MKLGFLTACLPELPLGGIAGWAAEQGFQALEVAAWPSTDERPFTATHIDAAAMAETTAQGIRSTFADLGLSISSLAYYENNLDRDPEVREAVNRHVLACVDAAVLLGVPTVGTFVGRDITRSVRDNLREAEKVLPPLVEYATERGIRLVVENCPMEGWHPRRHGLDRARGPDLARLGGEGQDRAAHRPAHSRTAARRLAARLHSIRKDSDEIQSACGRVPRGRQRRRGRRLRIIR